MGLLMMPSENEIVKSPMIESAQRAPLSVFDANIMRHLERHLAGEEVILDEYRALAASDDEPVRYIAQLIVEDEERHHRVLSEMLNQFRTGAWFIEQLPRVPWATPSTDRRALKETLRRLRAFERRDLRQLRQLDHSLSFMRRDSLNGVLVQALKADTRKHLLFLRALTRLTRRR